jgi:uncharacterized protein (DUF1330 family)
MAFRRFEFEVHRVGAQKRKLKLNSPVIPGYLIATLRVKNFDEYMQRYGMPAIAQLNEIGAEVQVASASPDVLEGDWDCNWTVVIRFPSKSKATDFYNSAGYTPLRMLRINELTDGGSLVIVEGLDPTAFG